MGKNSYELVFGVRAIIASAPRIIICACKHKLSGELQSCALHAGMAD
jgi:hypothetical protein